MPKKPTKPITQHDLETFHKAIEGTKPLMQKKIRLDKQKLIINRAKKHRSPTEEHVEINDLVTVALVQGEEFIAFKQSSISNKTLRKLRKGQYNVEAVLDLHGMTIEKARLAVESFLQQALSEGIRVVLIIHGKGHHSQQPVLKNKLNLWLRGINVVLAFCSAAPRHGSRGAIYVLLKGYGENPLE